MKKKEVCVWGGERGVENSLLFWDCWRPSACYFSSVALLSLRWLYLFCWHIGLTDWWGQWCSLINKSVLVHLSPLEYTWGGQPSYI